MVTHELGEALEEFGELLLLLLDAFQSFLSLLVDVSPWAPARAGQTAVQQNLCFWVLLFKGVDFFVKPPHALACGCIFVDCDAEDFTSFRLTAHLPKLRISRTTELDKQPIMCVRMRNTPLLQDFGNHRSRWGSGLHRAVSKLSPNANQPKGVFPLGSVGERLCEDVQRVPTFTKSNCSRSNCCFSHLKLTFCVLFTCFMDDEFPDFSIVMVA